MPALRANAMPRAHCEPGCCSQNAGSCCLSRLRAAIARRNLVSPFGAKRQKGAPDRLPGSRATSSRCRVSHPAPAHFALTLLHAGSGDPLAQRLPARARASPSAIHRPPMIIECDCQAGTDPSSISDLMMKSALRRWGLPLVGLWGVGCSVDDRFPDVASNMGVDRLEGTSDEMPGVV